LRHAPSHSDIRLTDAGAICLPHKEAIMTQRITRREKCAAGRHTPRLAIPGVEEVRRDTCRYCGQSIMRTQATRIWFLAAMLA
jgi:hypothetical protein